MWGKSKALQAKEKQEKVEQETIRNELLKKLNEAGKLLNKLHDNDKKLENIGAAWWTTSRRGTGVRYLNIVINGPITFEKKQRILMFPNVKIRQSSPDFILCIPSD